MNTPEQAPTPRAGKLNIFALPSYTAILFGLIAAVVLGVAFTAWLPGSQLWWPPVILGLTLLPLRDFLQWPDRLLREYGLSRTPCDRSTDHADDPTRREIEAALATLAPDRPPELCLTDMPVGIESFGTFRRRYVALGRRAADRLAHRLASPHRRQPYLAMLCHELAHFINHDMPLAQLSRSLLKMTVLVMTANIWIGLLLVALVAMVSPEVLRPEFWTGMSAHLASLAPVFRPVDLSWVPAALQAQNPYAFERLQDPAGRHALWLASSLYLLGAQLPFVLVGGVLWLVYWPRLMRIRELYADARAAQMLHDAEAPLRALDAHAFLMLAADSPARTLWQRWREGWTRGLSLKLPHLGGLFALHPDQETRRRCLADPVQVFGKPRALAVTVGLAVVLLDLATRGILTAAYIYEPGPFLPTLIAFIVTSTWLLPQVCVAGGQTAQGALTGKIALIVGGIAAIKLGMHFVDLGLVSFMRLTDAAGWGRAVDLWVYAMLGVGAEGPLPGLLGAEMSWTTFTELHVLRPMAYFGLALPPLLGGILWADASLKRRALTWYGLGEQVRRAFWISTGLGALLLALLVIPLLNHAFFPEIYGRWSPAAMFGVVSSLAAAVAAGLWFWRRDRRWAGRCPACGRPVTGGYYPGKSCPHEACYQLLHPWLVAAY